MLSKEQRQRLVQDIVSRDNVSTQGDLVKRLREAGVEVTQATVSRDLNEMGLVRLPMGKGMHRYVVANVQNEQDLDQRLAQLFQNFVYNVDRGENVIVVNTADGHAAGVAILLDRMRNNKIVGTLAGENTILVVGRTVAEAEELINEFTALMNGR